MQNMIFVCLGGALGSGARYWISLALPNDPSHGLPYGTLTVNFIGSLCLTFLLFTSSTHWNLSEHTRLFLTVGLLGGFTTYSTFNHEVLTFLDRGALGWAAIYLLTTMLACLFGGGLGMTLGRWTAG
jgi:CrcB protein